MFKKSLSLFVAVCFILTSLTPVRAHADVLNLPAPGTMISLSPAYQPVIIKGVTIHKDNPFLFDFIVDVGQDHVSGDALKAEGERLIKYFLAGLAIPDKQLWVNLSPYEKSRIIPEALGQTVMGRDLLEQDYILKQITASLIYPEKQLGKTFWDTVYAKAQRLYGTTHIPVDTFNKVWIMADKAEVFEHNQSAFVVNCHLKVMLEEDYLALKKHGIASSLATRNDIHSVGANIVRQIVLPELEKEVNTGRNFANLRQIFNSVLLASWYKRSLKQALLNQVYADKSKINGINLNDPTIKAQIYQQYLEAYKKGVFNYIKDDVNVSSGERMPRKYFSGGTELDFGDRAMFTKDPTDFAQTSDSFNGEMDLQTLISPAKINTDMAMTDGTMLGKVDFYGSELVHGGAIDEQAKVYQALLDDKTTKPVIMISAHSYDHEVSWSRSSASRYALRHIREILSSDHSSDFISEVKSAVRRLGNINKALRAISSNLQERKFFQNSDQKNRRLILWQSKVSFPFNYLKKRFNAAFAHGDVVIERKTAEIIIDYIAASNQFKSFSDFDGFEFLNATQGIVVPEGQSDEQVFNKLKEFLTQQIVGIDVEINDAKLVLSEIRNGSFSASKSTNAAMVVGNDDFMLRLNRNQIRADELERMIAAVDRTIKRLEGSSGYWEKKDLLATKGYKAILLAALERRKSADRAMLVGETPSLGINAEELARRIELDLQSPGQGNQPIPVIAAISDQHGTVDKFDQLLVNILRSVPAGQRIPEDFVLQPYKSLAGQLSDLGISLQDFKGQLFIHNLGDLMDRGPSGVGVFMRSKEMIDAGLSDFIDGNHDQWMFMNLLGFHLPTYDDFQFYGYTDAYDSTLGNVANILRQMHASDPQNTRNPKWWAEKLAEYRNFHEGQQKTLWKPVADKGKELTAQITTGMGKDEKKAWYFSKLGRTWGKFQGYNPDVGGDVATGVRAVGLVSVKWWEDLLAKFKEDLPGLVGTPQEASWNEAIDIMANQIIPTLKADLERELNGRQDVGVPEKRWWWRIFEAIDYENYRSPEWWSMDWVYHAGWGDSVLKEINAIEHNGQPVVTTANYLDDPILKEIAEFYQQSYTLHIRDIFQADYMHAFLPVDPKTGEFYFTYKGIEYRGDGQSGAPSYREGLAKIAQDVRDADVSQGFNPDIKEALSLVNNWYADETTIAKPSHVTDAFNNVGVQKIAEANGISILVTGHIPLHDFLKLTTHQHKIITGFRVSSPDGKHHFIFSDHGMGMRFGGGGKYIQLGRTGVHAVGLAGKNSSTVEVDAPTVLVDADGKETTVWENHPINGKAFLEGVLKDIQANSSRASAAMISGLTTPELKTRIRDVNNQILGFGAAAAVRGNAHTSQNSLFNILMARLKSLEEELKTRPDAAMSIEEIQRQIGLLEEEKNKENGPNREDIIRQLGYLEAELARKINEAGRQSDGAMAAGGPVASTSNRITRVDFANGDGYIIKGQNVDAVIKGALTRVTVTEFKGEDGMITGIKVKPINGGPISTIPITEWDENQKPFKPSDIDLAMTGELEHKIHAQASNGGIDLGTTGMHWTVSKDGNGVEINVDQAMLARIRQKGINYLSPFIFKMTPINIWTLAGVRPPAQLAKA